MNQVRRNIAKSVRYSAADLAFQRVYASHKNNGDEHKYRDNGHLVSFSKGLPHDVKTGLVSSEHDYQAFSRGILSGDARDFINTPLGPAHYLPTTGNNECWYDVNNQKLANCDPQGIGLRAWESQSAGKSFGLLGPDPQSIPMPPAPKLGSAELTGELAELYCFSLLRDVPFSDLSAIVSNQREINTQSHTHSGIPVDVIVDELSQLDWFSKRCLKGVYLDSNQQEQALSSEELDRMRKGQPQDYLFRGPNYGDAVGPIVSQFLLAGSQGSAPFSSTLMPSEGIICDGVTRLDQRVPIARANTNYLQTWEAWFDVQQGADVSGTADFTGTECRFVTTPRDLCTLVRYASVVQIFARAENLLSCHNVAKDSGLPYQQQNHIDHQVDAVVGSALTLRSLLCDVATSVYNVLQYQKFTIHKRARPEALAARMFKQLNGTFSVKPLKITCDKLAAILNLVEKDNHHSTGRKGSILLSQAFPEGSPMSPSYGSYHAAIAGACATVLKTYFDQYAPIHFAGEQLAFVPSSDGKQLDTIGCKSMPLTVEGELNKLASNIAMSRVWAGVNYYSDAIESLKLGEQVAIAVMQERKLARQERFHLSCPLFDGTTIEV